MYPHQQGQPGQQQYLHNIGLSNSAPQSFGMPMPGAPTMGFPTPQPAYPQHGYLPQTQSHQGYPQQGSMYPQPSHGNQQTAHTVYAPGNNIYPQSSTGYPNTNPGYPSSNSGYPQANTGYPQANAGYPQPTTGYPQSNLGYPAANTGYAQGNTGGYLQQSAYPTHGQFKNSTDKPKSNPTVVPANPFVPREDAAVLRKAMKGFGTDEKAIIQVLTRRSNEQRLRIAFEFKTLYGKDLISDLKSETSGKFKDLLVALMTPLPQFYAKELHEAVSGIGTDEDVLIEVMCTMSNHEIQLIKQAYTAIYGALLEDDLRGDTSGNFKRLMISLCVGNRSEDVHVDPEMARNDARSLLQAGELRLGTDESVFNAVLCSRSFSQLQAIFVAYQELTGHDIHDAINNEFSGYIAKALLAIVKVVRNKPLYFAERLHKSMKGLGTNDRQLIRVMVTRCEIDLGDIRDMFHAKFGETLKSWIESDCSGHYRKCLLGLLGLY